MPTDLELILLGTGTSSALPAISCLLQPESPKSCCSCRSTLLPSGSKNIRGNTSAVLRIPSTNEDGSAGRMKSLVIDVGKTFRESAIIHFAKNGIKEIDAILLTHPHFDAIGGLDDLRSWTLHQVVQKSIDIFCNQSTFTELERMFPYLTDRSQATGGGDVAHLNWIIFDDTKPLTILGVNVTPLIVEHGQFFTKPPTPYPCLGFLFNSTIAYISDVSNVPENVWELIGEECLLNEELPGLDQLKLNGVENEEKKLKVNGVKEKKKLKVLVIDCLRLEQHVSHIALPQAVAIARRLNVDRSYLIGFGHATSHQLWEVATKAFSSGAISTIPPQFLNDVLVREPKSSNPNLQYSGTTSLRVEDEKVFTDEALWRIESWEGGIKGGLWIRPGADGMTIGVEKEGKVKDDIYDDLE